MANQWRVMENIIEVNPMCKLNSLMENLNISNDIVDKIKVTQPEQENLQRLLTSLKLVKMEMMES